MRWDYGFFIESDIKIFTMRVFSKNFKLHWKLFDGGIFSIFLILVGVGLLSMGGIGEATDVFFQRQLVFLGVAVSFILALSFFDYRILKNYSFTSLAIYSLTLVLLLASLVSSSVRGINAWITIGPLRLEPSELAKLAVIILLAKYFSQKHVEIYKVHHIIVSGFYAGLPAFLVLIQPDLGSAFIFFAIWLSMLLAAGIKRKHLLIIFLASVVLCSVAWFSFLEPYQKSRISSFLNPYLDPRGEGYSIIQSKVAIGSGWFWGNGLGKGTQSKLGYLPEAHTDFAFASYAEQFGFIGIAGLFSALAYFLFRAGKIGFGARNNFAKLFSVGLIAFIFTHVMINAGMNMGLLPVTGIPFPFLSYGGSFLITLSLGIGLLESIRIRS